jgi:hypothetical protein
LGLHPRSAQDFFDALVALGFLNRIDGKYHNTPETDLFLDKRKPARGWRPEAWRTIDSSALEPSHRSAAQWQSRNEAKGAASRSLLRLCQSCASQGIPGSHDRSESRSQPCDCP